MNKERIKIKGCELIVIKPNTCTYCDKGIDPIIINKFAYSFYDLCNIVITYKCPCCEQIFFAKYQANPMTLGYGMECLYPFEVIGGHKSAQEFDECVKDISQDFIKIFNDAYISEQSGCTSIVGIAYRRAFEFLIKDYAIKYNPNDADTIKTMNLSDCIKKYSPTEDVKNLLLRASWVGNDFAHYESRHEDIDVNDLKQLILLSLDSIVVDVKKRNYISKIDKK